MLCLFCAMAVQGYEAETLWMQVVWLSQQLIDWLIGWLKIDWQPQVSVLEQERQANALASRLLGDR